MLPEQNKNPTLPSEDICLETIMNLIAADIQFTWTCSFWSRLIWEDYCRQQQVKSEVAMLILRESEEILYLKNNL